MLSGYMGRNSKVEERTEEILQGCYDVIDREGLESATLKNIGKEVKIAPSLVSHYFNKKEELIAGLVDFTFEKENESVIPYMDKGSTSAEKLHLYIKKMVTLYLNQNVSDKVFYACFYRSLYDKSINDKFKKYYDHEKSQLGNLINLIKEEKGEKDIDVEELVLLVNIFIEGVNFMHVVMGDSEKYKEITQKFTGIIEQMILQ